MPSNMFSILVNETNAENLIIEYVVFKVSNRRMEDFVKILDNRSKEDEGTLGKIIGSGSLFKTDLYLNVRDPLCADACKGKIMAALNSRRDYFSVKSQVYSVIRSLTLLPF